MLLARGADVDTKYSHRHRQSTGFYDPEDEKVGKTPFQLALASSPTNLELPMFLIGYQYPDLNIFFSALNLDKDEKTIYAIKFMDNAVTTLNAIRKLDRQCLNMIGVKVGHLEAFEEAVARLTDPSEILEAIKVDTM